MQTLNKINQCNAICQVEKFYLNFSGSSDICNDKAQFNYIRFLEKEVPGNSEDLLAHLIFAKVTDWNFYVHAFT